MILYHMSETLKLDDEMKPDYQGNRRLVEPFVQGLEQSRDCFCGMVLNAKYLYAVLCKERLREWSDYAKWATEGAFEFIRKTEFPDSYGRMTSNYFYDSLLMSKRLFEEGWGCESEEVRHSVHLFEVDVADAVPQCRDMNLFTEAYDVMAETQNIEQVLSCARRYFAGEQTAEPVWEIISDKPAKAVKDISEYLWK